MSFWASLDEIEEKTKEFRQSIIKPNGTHIISAESSKFMNTPHFDFTKLDYNTIFEVPRLLVRTTIFPRECRYYNVDRTRFFAWLAQLCNYSKWQNAWKDKGFRHLFNLLVSFHLKEYMILSNRVTDFHVTDFLNKLDILAACFAFPFLERCIRYVCDEYVKVDGSVVKDFIILERGKENRYKSGRRINNISHELKLLRNYVASPKFGSRLDNFLSELNDASKWNFADHYEIIKSWRNPLLHGERMSHIGLDFASYLISMLLLDQIPEAEYNKNLNNIVNEIEWMQKTYSPFLWFKYPIKYS